jgi:hypothetical protein
MIKTRNKVTYGITIQNKTNTISNHNTKYYNPYHYQQNNTLHCLLKSKTIIECIAITIHNKHKHNYTMQITKRYVGFSVSRWNVEGKKFEDDRGQHTVVPGGGNTVLRNSMPRF